MITRKPGTNKKNISLVKQNPKPAPKSLKKDRKRVHSVNVVIHSFDDTKRLWWQLSSLADQKPCGGYEIPQIKVTLFLNKRDPSVKLIRKMIKKIFHYLTFMVQTRHLLREPSED